MIVSSPCLLHSPNDPIQFMLDFVPLRQKPEKKSHNGKGTMHLVPAPAVKPLKRRVLSISGVNRIRCLGLCSLCFLQ